MGPSVTGRGDHSHPRDSQPALLPWLARLPLRTKLAVLYLLAILVIGGAAYVTDGMLVAHGFREAEHEAVVAQLDRAGAALQLRADDLYHSVDDWATWDASYDYVATLDPGFAKENLFQDSLATLGVTFMMFLDANGKPVKYLGYDLTSGAPDDRWRSVPSHVPGGLTTPSAGEGLVRLGDAAALVAYRPILRSDGSGPARGTLVMGHTIDSDVATKLSKALAARVSLSPASEPVVDAVSALGPDSIQGRTTLAGLDGGPAVLVQVQARRPVAAQARLTQRAMLLALIGVALAGGLAAALVLELQVSGPLTRLTRDVGRISEDADARQRVTVPRGRELGRLAFSVNTLLERLERRRAELTTRERRFRRLFVDSPVASAILTSGGRVVQCNPAFERIFGYTAEELRRPRGVLLIAADGGSDQEQEAMQSIASGRVQRYQWERRLVRKDGTPVYALMQMSGLERDPDETDTYIVQVLDFTARREREEEALTLAFQDPLTGLANRRVLLHRLSEAGHDTGEERGALIYLDLDRFKGVNDRCGHDVGDRVLVELTQRMVHQLRGPDLLARLGGDEFAAFLPDLTEGAARKVAERLAAAVKEPVDIGNGATARLAVSIGVAMGPVPDEEAERWLRRADEAMYRAKRSGGGRAVVATAPACAERGDA